MMRIIGIAAVVCLFTTAAYPASTAFVNVNVIPMTSERVSASQTVVVTDGVIAAIGPFGEIAVPDDAVIVDGTDRFLIPGIAEMHGHVPGLTSGNLDRVLSLYVANGVTTVRGMLGQPSHLVLRDDLRTGKVLGPRLVTSGPSFNGRSVRSPQEGAAMVAEQHEAGYDFLKIHPGLSLEEFNAVAAEADRLGIKFAGHVPEDVGLASALAAGIATIDHLDGYMQALLPAHEDPSGGLSGFFGVFIADQADNTRIRGIAAATAAAGVWNVPTESLFEHVVLDATDPKEMARWPEMKYMPPQTIAQWKGGKRNVIEDDNYRSATAKRAVEIRRELIVALAQADAGLLLGSDSPQIFNVPGFALHHELAYLVDAGLSPFEALRTGTENPARFLDAEDVFGTIQTGLEADLLLLDANPLDNIHNSKRIHGVMVRGKWLSRPDLDRMLRRLEH